MIANYEKSKKKLVEYLYTLNPKFKKLKPDHLIKLYLKYLMYKYGCIEKIIRKLNIYHGFIFALYQEYKVFFYTFVFPIDYRAQLLGYENYKDYWFKKGWAFSARKIGNELHLLSKQIECSSSLLFKEKQYQGTKKFFEINEKSPELIENEFLLLRKAINEYFRKQLNV